MIFLQQFLSWRIQSDLRHKLVISEFSAREVGLYFNCPKELRNAMTQLINIHDEKSHKEFKK